MRATLGTVCPAAHCGIVLGTVVLILDPHVEQLAVLRGAIGSIRCRNPAQGPGVHVLPVFEEAREEIIAAAEITASR